MTTPKQKLDQLEEYIREFVPDYERKVKEESGLMKFLNFFARIFNDRFMDGYITTIYPKVYWPRGSERDANGVFWTTAHEAVHLLSAKNKTPFVHTFLYGFPQWLTLLAFLSLGAIWGGKLWLLNLLWLLCLAPLPAPFRTAEEKLAYTMSMAVYYWRWGNVPDAYVERLATQFYTAKYYFMWPFKKSIIKALHKEKDKIAEGKFDNDPLFARVKAILKEELE